MTLSRDQQHTKSHKLLSIDGLWALLFGNGGRGGDPNVLYFTAGPSSESHGLCGSLRPKGKDEGNDRDDR